MTTTRRTRTDRVDLALRRAFAAFALVVAVFLAGTLLPGTTTPLRVAALAFVVGILALGTVSWLRPASGWLVAVVALTGGALLLAGRLASPEALPEAMAMVVAYLAGLVAVFARRAMVLALVGLVVWVVGIGVVRPYDIDTLAALGPAVAAAVAMVLCVRLMERMDERFERARADHLAAVRDAVEQEARLAAHHRAQAILHDDVLAALRACGTAAVPREDAAASAERAWYALVSVDDERHATRDLVTDLREVEVPGLAVDLTTAQPELALPAPVAQAVRDAVAEALRNARRHAGVETATVLVRGDRRALRVAVADSGRGFDPDRTSQSYGLEQSVRRRMSDVGGRAIVVSAPGAGTRIELDWRERDWVADEEEALLAVEEGVLGGAPHTPLVRTALRDENGPPGAVLGAGGCSRRDGRESDGADRGTGGAIPRPHPHAPETTLTSVIGDPRLAAVCAIAPFAALALMWAVIGLAGGQPWWLGGWALVLTGYGAYVLWRGEPGAVPPSHELLHVLGLTGVVAFLAQAPPGTFETELGWPVSLAALVAAPTAIYRGGWSVVGVTGAFVGVVTLTAVLTSPDPAGSALVAALPAILSTCWPLAVGATLRAVVIALGARAEAEAALTRETVAREGLARRRTAALDNRLTHLRTLLDPTLGRIARGEADLSDPRVQREALDAERTARDELTLPWSLTPALIRVIRSARAAGVEITLTTTSDLVRTPPAARLLLQTVLEEAHPRRVTLTVAADDAPVSLVAEVADDADRAAVIEALRSRGIDVRDVAGTVLARA